MPILALRQLGRRAEADRLLERAIARFNQATRAGYSHPERDVMRAELLLLRGHREEALAALERAAARGWVNQSEPFIGLSDPVFDPIRGDVRFRAVAHRIATEVAREQRELAAAGVRI